jgi:hypothetical protein
MASRTRTRTHLLIGAAAVVAAICIVTVGYLTWQVAHPSTTKVESYVVDQYGASAADCKHDGDDFACSVRFKTCTVSGRLMNDGDQFPWIGTSSPLSRCPGYVER